MTLRLRWPAALGLLLGVVIVGMGTLDATAAYSYDLVGSTPQRVVVERADIVVDQPILEGSAHDAGDGGG